MSQSFAPFYDVNRTYEDNYLQGPFGAFAEVMKDDSAAGASAQSAQTTQSQSSDQVTRCAVVTWSAMYALRSMPSTREPWKLGTSRGRGRRDPS